MEWKLPTEFVYEKIKLDLEIVFGGCWIFVDLAANCTIDG